MRSGYRLLVILQLLPLLAAQSSLRGGATNTDENAIVTSSSMSADAAAAVVDSMDEIDDLEEIIDDHEEIDEQPERQRGSEDVNLPAPAFNGTKFSAIDQFHRVERADNHMFPGFSTRIIGGRDANMDDDSHVVSLHDENGKHFCGASLITKDCVLTAAHCARAVTGKGPITVVLGRQNLNNQSQGERLRVRYEKTHPKYDIAKANIRWGYDFAIMCMWRPTMTNAKIVKLNKNPNLPTAGQRMEVAGWGDMDPRDEVKNMANKLQKATLRTVSNKQCAAMTGSYESYSVSFSGHIQDDMLCAKNRNRDSCQGDSGGPLIGQSDKIQYGITSWGVGCGHKFFPGVYARVSSAFPWIRRNVCSMSMLPPPEFACNDPW